STLAGDPTNYVTSGVHGVGAAAPFVAGWGTVTGHAGSLYAAHARGNQVRKIDIAAATVTTIAGSATGGFGYADGFGAAALFNFPQGLALDGAGELYVAGVENNVVRRVV